MILNTQAIIDLQSKKTWIRDGFIKFIEELETVLSSLPKMHEEFIFESLIRKVGNGSGSDDYTIFFEINIGNDTINICNFVRTSRYEAGMYLDEAKLSFETIKIFIKNLDTMLEKLQEQIIAENTKLADLVFILQKFRNLDRPIWCEMRQMERSLRRFINKIIY
jgi:hypothetical protein